MTELTFTILKYGFLALLWLFVWLAVRSLHKDILTLSPRPSKKHRKRERMARQATQAPASVTTPARTAGGTTHSAPQTRSSQSAGMYANSKADAGAASAMAHAATPLDGESPSLLVIIDGPLAGTTVPLLGDQLTLGRAPSNTVVLEDEFVSSHHARIFYDSGSQQWAIEDLHSTNGTVVGGAPLHGAMILPPRVTVRIGATTLELR